MANYNDLITAIDSVIKTNNRREITGQLLQNVLNTMVGSLGENYQLAGFATPTTNPHQPDQNVFYVASQAGVYTQFDNIVLGDGISFLMWKNGAWTSQTISMVTQSWVQQNYVSKEWFRKVFRVYDEDGLEIVPNDMDSVVDNIKAMVGLWTNEYLSALGMGRDGGGTTQTLAQLNDVQLGTLANGDALVYNTAIHKWENKQIQTGVDMSVVWAALAANTNEQINASHLATALSGYVTSANLSTMLNDYATKAWAGQNFITVEWFDKLFQLYNGTEAEANKIAPNGALPVNQTQLNIEAMFGFWTKKYISTLGQGDDGSTSYTTLAQLNDVNLSNPTANQVLSYNGTHWVNRSIELGSQTLADLADVVITSPAANQMLSYDATTQKWVNAAIPATGVTSVATGTGLTGGTITGSGTISINSTYQTYISHGESAYNSLGNYLPLSGGTMTGTLTSRNIAPSASNTYHIGASGSEYAEADIRIINARHLNYARSFVADKNVYIQYPDDAGDTIINPTSGNVLMCSDVFVGTSAIGFNRNTENGNVLVSGKGGAQINYSSDGRFDIGTMTSTGVYSVRMAILQSNGNIGIGTLTPTNTLDVIGSTRVTGLLTALGNITTDTANGSFIQVGNIRLVYDSTNNALKVIKSDGTAANFYATGGVSALGAGQESGGGGDVTWALLASQATGGRYIHQSYISGALSNYLPLSGGTLTNTSIYPVLNITNTYNSLWGHGIDITFPNQPISSYQSSISFGVDTNENNEGVIAFGYFGNNSTNNAISLGFNANDHLFYLQASGNVGIGTTNPERKLDVYGTIQAGETYKVVLENRDDGGSLTFWGTNWLKGYIDAANIVMQLYSSGNVGIGTNPSYKLHVVGACAATSFTNISDIRQKDLQEYKVVDINTIANAPSFTFYWKDRKIDSDLHIGTSAQYWKAILPEAVTEAKDEMGTLSMQYGVAALISAISIARKVMTHEEKIALLETRVSALEKENGEQEQLINSLQEELAKLKAA